MYYEYSTLLQSTSILSFKTYLLFVLVALYLHYAKVHICKIKALYSDYSLLFGLVYQ